MELVSGVYLHIGNGGVQFTAGTDEMGHLALGVEISHFGNTTNSMKIFTDAESMKKIGELFIEAAKQPHEEYACAAKHQEWNEAERVLNSSHSVD